MISILLKKHVSSSYVNYYLIYSPDSCVQKLLERTNKNHNHRNNNARSPFPQKVHKSNDDRYVDDKKKLGSYSRILFVSSDKLWCQEIDRNHECTLRLYLFYFVRFMLTCVDVLTVETTSCVIKILIAPFPYWYGCI
jgi:hypothetical protein